MPERERGRIIMFPRKVAGDRPSTPRSAGRPTGLADGERRCSPSEVLQVMMQVEDARQKLEAHAVELSRLADESAKLSRTARSRNKLDVTTALRQIVRPSALELVELANLLNCRNQLPDLEREWVSRLQDTGERLLGRIEAISDLQALEAGDLALEPYEFSLDDLVSQCFHVISGEAERKQVELVVSRAEDVPIHLYADGERLGQILLALLENAIQGCPESKLANSRVEVGIQVVPSNPDRCMLLFTVIDNGVGMNEQQSNEFLSWGDMSSAHPGLALARRIAEQMDGGMGVRSQAGVGTEFWFTVQTPALHFYDGRPPESSMIPGLNQSPKSAF